VFDGGVPAVGVSIGVTLLGVGTDAVTGLTRTGADVAATGANVRLLAATVSRC